MREFQFNVFGTKIVIVDTVNGWAAYSVGPRGKRRHADFLVPDYVDEDDLGQYLADLFQESAGSGRAGVKQLSK